MLYTYIVYDLIVRLPFPCPPLTHAPEGATADVNVVDGTVPRTLAAPLAEGPMWQAEPGRFLFRGGKHAGDFLAEGGNCVTLERHPEAEEELLCFYFFDIVLAAILRQRGLLVLHANAAVTPNGAVAISGESGAGKSTTLAALLQHNCAMLSDDITTLRLENDGHVQVLPGMPLIHLSEDAAAGLGHDIAGLPRHRWRRLKAAIPTQTVMAMQPARLHALYLLQKNTDNDLRVQALTGAAKFAAVQTCVYGPLLPQEHPGQFPLFSAIAEQVTVSCIKRPDARWTVRDVINVILNG
ncbi:MAG: hypothetical protein NTW95_03420 [Candidatus Aminicenantes bacterium]|nr:hypothetical protein [Candidatus Aminicenantes bacterium]